VATAPWSSASTSARSISSASSPRHARSQRSCSGLAVRDTRSTARQGPAFPLSRDELVECAALLDSVGRGELDRLAVPNSRSMCWRSRSSPKSRRGSGRRTSSLRSSPRLALSRAGAGGFCRRRRDALRRLASRRGRRGARLHHDAVNHMLRGRRGARLTALTSGGAIPDTADYQVLLEPENQIIAASTRIGRSRAWWRRLPARQYGLPHPRVERGTVRVEDAQGMAPNIPFWLGEAPGRTDELSQSVSRLRAEIAARLPADPGANVFCPGWLTRSGSPSPRPSNWSNT